MKRKTVRYVDVKVRCPECGEEGVTSVPFYAAPKKGQEAIEQPHLVCPSRGQRVFEGFLRVEEGRTE